MKNNDAHQNTKNTNYLVCDSLSECNPLLAYIQGNVEVNNPHLTSKLP